ncbi:MAG: hypothetical protein ABSE05_06865 [Syntrophales bacterium]|jgi:hypothetical protein
MEGIETILSLDETVSEIATILAQGYLRYRKGRLLGNETPNQAVYAAKVKESNVVTEN